MDRVDLCIVNVCFGGLRPEGLGPMERQAESLHREHPRQFHFCSTYDLAQREEPD